MPDTDRNVILHGYFRSSSAYRVRIALNLKGIPFRQKTYHLPSGVHREPAYLKINPQGLVPSVEMDGLTLTQSLAICEYLDETTPLPPLLPAGSAARAKARAFAAVISCDVHPVQNLGVLNRLRLLDIEEDRVISWARQAIDEGLQACDDLLKHEPGPFCFGGSPCLADVTLVPQLANARRFGVDVRWPRLLAAEEACLKVAAFADAAPDKQPDAT